MRLSFFLLLWVFCIFSTFAQSNLRPDYKLLWKIEGNGLKKPSYLFGTMHLYDNRVYDFSDSVLVKLKECDAFAMETHPDSIVKVVLNWMLDGHQQDKFKEMLSKKEYSELDSLVRLRSGYTLEKLKSPRYARILLEKKIGKKNKHTFLDAYLYSVARSFGKKIIGLENAHDQLELLEPTSPSLIKSTVLQSIDNTNETTNSLGEKLIAIYQRGNIDELQQFLKSMQLDSAYYKKMFVNRNHIQAASIEKEIRNHSTFIAVGAGHLPGNEGVIKLLQQAGFKVTRVKPSFTGLAKKFKIEKTDTDWETFKNQKGAFSVQMPTPPITYRIDSINMTLQASIDISGPSFFQSTYVAMDAELRGKPSDVILSKMQERLRKRNAEKVKHVQVSGADALEFSQASKNTFFRCLFVLRDPYIYFLQVGPNKEAAFSPEADRFFSSIRFENFKDEQWTTLKDEDGAFETQFYGSSKKRVARVPYNSLKIEINSYISENIGQKESYLIRYNNLPSGYVSTNDSIYYESFANDLITRMNGKNLKLFNANIDGFSGKEFTFELANDIVVKGREVLRGSRFYLLMATASKNGNAATSGINTLLSSFRFTNYKESVLTEYTLNEIVKVGLPAPFRYDSTSSNELQHVFCSVDPSSGIQILVKTQKFEPYEYYENLDSLMKKRYKLDSAETILESRKITEKKLTGEERTVTSTVANRQVMSRIMVSGKDLIEVTVYLPTDFSKTNLVPSFFNSVKITTEDTPWNIFSSKTDAFLADVFSEDTLINEPAKSALYSFEIKENELPKLYKAIRTKYPNDNNEQTSIKHRLINKLKETHDSTTIPFIRDVYAALPPTKNCRSAALSALASFRTRESADAWFSLFANENSVKLDGSSSLYEFYDSLSLFEPMLLKVIVQADKFDHKGYLYSLIASVLKKLPDNSEEIQKISKLLIADVKKDMPYLKLPVENDDDYYSKGNDLEQLAITLTLLPANEEVLTLLEKFVGIGYLPANLKAIPFLIKNKRVVSKSDMEKLASKPLSRASFYESLKEVGYEKVFPSAFLSQEKIAESKLMIYMNEDDGAPEFSEFVESKTIEINKEHQRVYVYKFRWSNDSDWYIALSGPYKGKELTTDDSLTYGSGVKYSKETFKKDLAELLESSNVKIIK